jgi:hypothetical protein
VILTQNKAIYVCIEKRFFSSRVRHVRKSLIIFRNEWKSPEIVIISLILTNHSIVSYSTIAVLKIKAQEVCSLCRHICSVSFQNMFVYLCRCCFGTCLPKRSAQRLYFKCNERLNVQWVNSFFYIRTTIHWDWSATCWFRKMKKMQNAQSLRLRFTTPAL